MKNKRMTGKYDSITDGATKVCTFCGTLLPISEFAKNGIAADGTQRYRDDCKTCYNIRRRENATKKKHTSFVCGMKRRGEVNVAYTHQQWKETVIFFKGQCAYCGRTMRNGERLTHDHLVPISDGGASTQHNIIPACSTCNSSKGASEWREWFMKQSFFSQERMNKIFQWRSIMNAIGDTRDDSGG